jgi:hypothetical protein
MLPASRDTNRLVEVLEGLMERLNAPDLTAAEAKLLRPKVFALLRSLEAGEPGRDGPPAPRNAGQDSGRCLIA